MITELLAIVNAILAAMLSFYALRYIRKAGAVARWLKLFTALLGIYWCGLYIFVALNEPGVIDPVLFGQYYVRPAFTLTLAVMAGGAVYRWRSDDD